jgi:hypothetical protein
MYDLYKEENEQILQERLIAPVEQYLDLNQWGFELQYKNSRDGYVAIYNSPSCRLRCSLSHDPRDKDDTITFEYSRIHAPDEEYYMVYQGENCLAWHAFYLGHVGQFLDGIEPRILARARIEQTNLLSQASKTFEESESSKGLRNPIWGLRLEAFIWDYYGNSLFELFDVRHPQKWAAYRRYLTEFYNELSTDPLWKKELAEWPDWKPFPWQVC